MHERAENKGRNAPFRRMHAAETNVHFPCPGAAAMLKKDMPPASPQTESPQKTAPKRRWLPRPKCSLAFGGAFVWSVRRDWRELRKKRGVDA